MLKKQMIVMDYVNALIHYCLEIYLCKKHIVKIEDIGRETFEMSCKKYLEMISKMKQV